MFQGDDATTVIGLSPAIDRAAARETFAATGRVRVKDVMTEEAAQAIHQCMSRDLDWGISYNDGAASKHIPKAQVAILSQEERAGLLNDVVNRAARQFQYAFAEAPVMQTYNPDAPTKNAVHCMLEYVNSAQFFQFMSDVTTDDKAYRAELLACCYQPGHFVNIHSDRDPGGLRQYGFAFDFTPRWRPDWGGSHIFFEGMDGDGDITEGFNGLFNSLVIYRVPQRYAISYVAPFAGGGRFVLTGWLQTPKPVQG